MISYHYKKLALVGITAIIFGIFLALPQRAGATVPVSDDDTHSKLQGIQNTLQNICVILGGSSRCAGGKGGGGGGGGGFLGSLFGGGGGGGGGLGGTLGSIGSSIGGSIGGAIGGAVGGILNSAVNLVGGIVGCLVDQFGLSSLFGSQGGGGGGSGSTKYNMLDQTGSLVSKEYSCDTIAYSITKVLLHQLTKSVVKWIQTGSWDGGPLFITDFKSYMMDAADQASGAFMKEFLSPGVYNAICSPFRLNLQIALRQYSGGGYAYGQRMSCTLSSVIRNATDFSKSLEANGWRNWISVSLNPQNDPHMALLTTLDELSERRAEAQSRAQTESVFNQGFLAQKTCVEYYDNQWTGEHRCIRYENNSPGRWIADQIMQASGSDWRELEAADEIKESITAILNALISSAFQGRGIFNR